MEALKDKLINAFCKVEFLCYSGEPNWLGWVVLGIAALVTAFVALILLGIVIVNVEDLWKRLSR